MLVELVIWQKRMRNDKDFQNQIEPKCQALEKVNDDFLKI